MEILLNEAVIAAGILSPIILILVQLVKQLEIDNRYLPFISILLGVFCGLVLAAASKADMFVYGLAGFLAGASASGLYDSGKALGKGE